MSPPSPAFKWHYKIVGNNSGIPLLWLHGFMGCGNDWLNLAQDHFSDFCNILVDLPGHGKSVLTENIEFTYLLHSLVKQLSLENIKSYIPIGYSMGGRLAFHLQQYVPERIPALVFLSSAPGLKSTSERQQRIIEDRNLIGRLNHLRFSAFLKQWYSSALFGNITNDSNLFTKLCQTRSQNDLTQLHQALELMGNGALPSLWENLSRISVPTLLLTGALDLKYFQLNQEINRHISGSIHSQVTETGHAFQLEKPLETARIIRHFLSGINEGE